MKQENSIIESPLDYKDVYPLCERYKDGKDDSETLAVIMDNEFIDEIQKIGSRVVAVFGRHADGTVTVSLLALEPGKIEVAAKHVDGTAPGQQVWPRVTIADFEKLLPPPK